jgi:hypothetical protein
MGTNFGFEYLIPLAIALLLALTKLVQNRPEMKWLRISLSYLLPAAILLGFIFTSHRTKGDMDGAEMVQYSLYLIITLIVVAFIRKKQKRRGVYSLVPLVGLVLVGAIYAFFRNTAPSSVGECFSPSRNECMRVNCFKRHLKYSKKEETCEEIESQEKKRGIPDSNSYYVSAAECAQNVQQSNETFQDGII